ncbi:MAG: hypothetical protein ACI4WY_10905 [Anaerovoracaceae bacterium]
MKKVFALLLSVVLILCAMPMTVFAEDAAFETGCPSSADSGKINISEAVVTIEKTEYVYTGREIRPAVTSVKLAEGTEETVLKAGIDFDVAYTGNINAGTAVVTVIGKGVYEGSVSVNFTISPAKLSDCKVVLSQDAYTAIGTAVVPTFTVMLDEYILEVNKDFTAALSNNIAIGDGKLTVTGTGNFTGTLEVKFSIVSKAVSDLSISVVTPVVSFDGRAKTPVVEVKDGNVTLIAGADYTVHYENNINAGTAKAIVTGKGRYEGTASVEFTIRGASNTVTTEYTSYTKYMTSKIFNLNASATGNEAGSGFIYTSSNENVVRVTSGGDVIVVGTGKATITVKTTGTREFDPAEKVVTVTVKPLKPSVTLTSPARKQVKVIFNKVEGATKYQICYGRNGVYYFKYVKHLDNQYTKTYALLKNRTSGKTYYIKVRAVTEMEDGTVVYGNWTDVKSIKSK